MNLFSSRLLWNRIVDLNTMSLMVYFGLQIDEGQNQKSREKIQRKFREIINFIKLTYVNRKPIYNFNLLLLRYSTIIF